MRYRVEVATVEQFTESIEVSQLDYIYTPVNVAKSIVPLLAGGGRSSAVIQKSKHRIIVLPSVFTCESLQEMYDMGFTRALANTIGHIQIFQNVGLSIHGGLRLNITNSVAMEQYEKLGLVDSILSIELSLQRMKSLKSVIPRGFIAYGKFPMMLLRRFPKVSGLTDRKDKFLPLIHGNGEAELLNPVSLILSDRMGEFSDMDFAVFKLMPGESVQEVLALYKKGVKPKEDFTRGLYYK